MSTAVIVYKTGFTERYPHVEHFRVSDDKLTIYIDHKATPIELALVESFEFLPETAHAI